MADRVEIVTIGDELLLGFTIDTNAAFIARALAEVGVAVSRRVTVGDDTDAIARAVRDGLDRTGAVITTGGLGPTTDDVTREAVAAAFGRVLRVDDAHLAWMRERWRTRFGRDMPESNRRQALIPEGARKLDNRHGSAPGILLEDERHRFVVTLPGVPRELRGMVEDTLVPLLRERGMARDGGCIRSLTLRTTGIAESLLQDQLRDLTVPDAVPRSDAKDLPPAVTLSDAKDLPPAVILSEAKDLPPAVILSEAKDLQFAYLPGVDGVDLRITVTAPSAAAATARLTQAADAIRGVVGQHVYGEDDADLARVLLHACRARAVRVAVAESCTGGLLGARLTSVPGSSDVFVGGVIAYANDVKVRELGVSAADLAAHGAVSETVVRQMALGAQRKFGVNLALAITGIAGPDGGTPEKPVGLVWIGVAHGDRLEARKIQSWGDRQEVRHRAAQAAMELARRLVSS